MAVLPAIHPWLLTGLVWDGEIHGLPLAEGNREAMPAHCVSSSVCQRGPKVGREGAEDCSTGPEAGSGLVP